MVNRVVPVDELESQTMEMAHQIAQMHPFALAMAKRAVNQTLDIMGQYVAQQSVFDMHSLAHGNALSLTCYPVMANLDDMKTAQKDK
jgi:1,4-dihydroxy-2-naphthoyl-CoA synthase